ncbi:hypothetical protein OHB26_28215 [Nocardia sp. NBC_01503]|uniref:hypothetical protein n=1 Tax=Nocardia sp. NBC_01503 TaxID=2975997 RepID=UPI002E7BC99C|nr:hypothetical protein [Nocardia sp. NBC_01503]WTL30792.1 hypothetical protein OHB26_28215 [Nocardia sp. NBC_01503]
MRHTLTIGFGMIGLAAAAGAVLAPSAAAQDLAEGVGCAGFTCHNDTDDTYRVEATVLCSNGVRIPITRYLAPHGREIPVSALCPMITEPGHWVQQPPVMDSDGWKTQPPTFEPGPTRPNPVVSVDYQSAVVDNDPQPAPSGSGA